VTGMSTTMLLRKLGLGGICRCLDVLASYMILQRVTPVTHSVGNCVKRAVVIAFSIVFFKTKMTKLNILGTLLALAGVFVYSLIVSACKQNYFGPDSPFCKPIYEPEVELVEGAGI
jgi:solute carrier family 35, member E1